MSATDADGDPLAYRLEGPDAASFDLDTETGQLRTRPGIEYDHEARSLYSVTVRATDPLNASAIITVAVHVTDVAEKPATPAAPLVRALEESSTSLRVRWTAPDRNGGPPLTDYDVEYRRGASGPWRNWQHDGTATTTTITGLSTSTDYEVRVRAFNGEALSDWSPPGNGRTNATANGWLARFGRTVAQHLLEGVEHRLTSPRQAGLQGAIAGHGFGDAAPGTGYRLALGDGLGERLLPWDGGHLETARLLMERDAASRMGQTLLMGSTFELTGETARRGVFGVWGRGGYSRFDGREQVVSLDGGVSTGTLGVDYAKGRWLAGLALSHSRGIGSYGRVYSQDDIEASLTGLYPYAGFKVTNRFSVWGVGGFGAGALTLTPQGDAPIETDIGLGVIAAGARGMLVTAASGFDLALETDAFWVRATSEAALGLLETDAVVTRLRLGLESTYAMGLSNGSTLTPKLDIGLRHDDGDAETGLGVDFGAGLAWWAPARVLFVELQARSILVHQAEGLRDWSVSGLVRYDPNPVSDRGLSASLKSSLGSAALGGVDPLLGRDALAGLASSGAVYGGRLAAEAAYGFPILSGRLTGAPWAGMEMRDRGHDYRVGYRISPARQSGSDMQFGIEGTRRQNGNGNAEAEHAIGLRLALGW